MSNWRWFASLVVETLGWLFVVAAFVFGLLVLYAAGAR